LSPSTDYDVWFVHTNVALDDSTPVKADFATLAAGSGVKLSFSTGLNSQYLMMGWI